MKGTRFHYNGHFDSAEFNRFIADWGVYGFFEKPITLKSGRQSHYYANWRKVVSDVWAKEKLAEFILSYAIASMMDVDTFYGVPDGATPVALEAQSMLAHVSPNYGPGSHASAMGRAVPKDHGDPENKYFVTPPRDKIALIEDVTTTGGSTLNTIDFLLESGKDVRWVISLTNRMEIRDDGLTAKEAIEQKGIEYHAMSNSLELIPVVYKELNPADHIARAIEKEFEEHGIAPLKLLK